MIAWTAGLWLYAAASHTRNRLFIKCAPLILNSHVTRGTFVSMTTYSCSAAQHVLAIRLTFRMASKVTVFSAQRFWTNWLFCGSRAVLRLEANDYLQSRMAAAAGSFQTRSQHTRIPGC
jgi:hypothetical protein